MKIENFFVLIFIISVTHQKTRAFKKVKQLAARSLQAVAQRSFAELMTDVLRVRAEHQPHQRALFAQDIARMKNDEIFKQEGVYSVIPDDSAQLSVIHKIDKITNKKDSKLTGKLEQRYTERVPNVRQMDCGLYVQIGELEYHPSFKQARTKFIFRSSCKDGPEIKYFILKKQDYIPEYVEFNLGDKKFRVKYDFKTFKKIGRGGTEKQTLDMYQLQSFFKIKYKLTREQREEIRKRELEVSKLQCNDQCNRIRNSREKNQCKKNCELQFKYVPQRRLKLQNIKTQMPDNQRETRQKNPCSCKHCNRLRNRFDKKYCNLQCKAKCKLAKSQINSEDKKFLHIKYKKALTDNEIISMGSHENQSGFFDFQVVDRLWNSDSIVQAKKIEMPEQGQYLVTKKIRGRPIKKKKLLKRVILSVNLG